MLYTKCPGSLLKTAVDLSNSEAPELHPTYNGPQSFKARHRWGAWGSLGRAAACKAMAKLVYSRKDFSEDTLRAQARYLLLFGHAKDNGVSTLNFLHSVLHSKKSLFQRVWWSQVGQRTHG